MNQAREIATLSLEAFTCYDRQDVLADLTACMNECGGWVLERRAVSAKSMEFRVELNLEDILELYGSLMGTGIELTCRTHAMLTDLCTCRSNAAHLGTVDGTVVLRLVLHFRERVTMPMVLAMCSAGA